MGHKVYPYLLRGLEIAWPNQVWAMDITYIPMAKGFVYLAVVLDWFSRRVLWRLWRTVKYEEVYLHAYDSVPDTCSIGRYLDLYNRRRPHSSLDGMTPDQAYYGAHSLPPVRLAA